MIIGTISSEPDENHKAFYFIGEYEIEHNQWSTLYEESHSDMTYIEPRLYGILDNGDGTKVAAISFFRAGGSAGSEEFHILRYRESSTEQKIISGFHHTMTIHSPETYTVNEEEKQITINEEYGAVNYKLEDNLLMSEDGFGIRLYTGEPITTNQRFIDLLDNNYFKAGTFFGDSSFDAEANDENLIHKDAHEGGYNSQFEDYAVLYGYDDPIIDTIILYGFDDLLVGDLETVMNQQIEVKTIYNSNEDRDETYANFTFDGYRYHAEFSSSEHGVIESLVISNDFYSE